MRIFASVLTLMMLGQGALAACAEKDLTLEDETLGVVYADDLSSDETGTVFTNPCFELQGLQWTTAELSIVEGKIEAASLQVTAPGVTGQVRQLTGTTEEQQLQGAEIQLELPLQQLGDLNLLQGQYLLRGDATRTQQGWQFDTAILEKPGSNPPERYALQEATLQGNRLQAREALLVKDKNNVRVSGLNATPEDLQADTTEFCVCRVPDFDEITLQGSAGQTRPDALTFEAVQLNVYGLTFPLGAAQFPLDPALPRFQTLSALLQDMAQELQNRPIGVSAGGEHQDLILENLPVTWSLKTRLTVGVRGLGLNPSPELLLSHQEEGLKITAGLPRPATATLPWEPNLLVDVQARVVDPVQVQVLFNSLPGAERKLSAAYVLRAEGLPLQNTTEVGWREQGFTAAPFVKNDTALDLVQQTPAGQFEGHFRVQVQLAGGQAGYGHEARVSWAHTTGQVDLQLQHTSRRQLGSFFFASDRKADLEETRLNTTLHLLQDHALNLHGGWNHNWLQQKGQPSLQLDTAVLQLGWTGSLNLQQGQLESWKTTAALKLQPSEAWQLQPRVSINQDQQLGFGLGTFYSTDCYTYNLDLGYEDQKFSLKVGFQLR